MQTFLFSPIFFFFCIACAMPRVATAGQTKQLPCCHNKHARIIKKKKKGRVNTDIIRKVLQVEIVCGPVTWITSPRPVARSSYPVALSPWTLTPECGQPPSGYYFLFNFRAKYTSQIHLATLRMRNAPFLSICLLQYSPVPLPLTL